MIMETSMPVTAKDVAHALNLSQSTVSRILSGDTRQRATEDTRRRVFEAAERLGYQPNAVARSLRHGRTNVIGMHTRHNYDVRNEFFGTVVGALQRACNKHHLDLMLHNAYHGSPAEVMYGKLRDGRIDGLLLHAGTEDPLVNLLSNSTLPVVVLADPLPNLPSVTCDDASGMVMLLDLLWQRGYRHFAFLTPRVWLPSVERRQKSFEAELERRGVAPEARRIIPIDYENAAPALDKLKNSKVPLVACCWNDRTAYKLWRACKSQKVRIPEDLAITGFDGFRDDQMPAGELVTVKCPWENVVEEALNHLVSLIDSRQAKQPPPPPQEICLPVTVLDGDTA